MVSRRGGSCSLVGLGDEAARKSSGWKRVAVLLHWHVVIYDMGDRRPCLLGDVQAWGGARTAAGEPGGCGRRLARTGRDWLHLREEACGVLHTYSVDG